MNHYFVCAIHQALHMSHTSSLTMIFHFEDISHSVWMSDWCPLALKKKSKLQHQMLSWPAAFKSLITYRTAQTLPLDNKGARKRLLEQSHQRTTFSSLKNLWVDGSSKVDYRQWDVHMCECNAYFCNVKVQCQLNISPTTVCLSQEPLRNHRFYECTHQGNTTEHTAFIYHSWLNEPLTSGMKIFSECLNALVFLKLWEQEPNSLSHDSPGKKINVS